MRREFVDEAKLFDRKSDRMANNKCGGTVNNYLSGNGI